MLKLPSTSEYPLALESLQQHRIDIDMEQLEEMIAAATSEDLHKIVVSFTIVD